MRRCTSACTGTNRIPPRLPLTRKRVTPRRLWMSMTRKPGPDCLEYVVFASEFGQRIDLDGCETTGGSAWRPPTESPGS